MLDARLVQRPFRSVVSVSEIRSTYIIKNKVVFVMEHSMLKFLSNKIGSSLTLMQRTEPTSEKKITSILKLVSKEYAGNPLQNSERLVGNPWFPTLPIVDSCFL